MTGPQCEAITLPGRRCRRPTYSTTHECRWYGLHIAAPSAERFCSQHMPKDELDLVREATESQPDSWVAARWKVLPDQPACWSWPVPSEVDPADPWSTVVAWQAGRCALCGSSADLVTDHCHDSDLKRGMLCPGCNIHEGACPKSPCGCDGYREKPPASLLGVRVLYGVGYVAAESSVPGGAVAR